MKEKITIWQRFGACLARTLCSRQLEKARNEGYQEACWATSWIYWGKHKGLKTHAASANWAVQEDAGGVYLVREGFQIANFVTRDHALAVFARLHTGTTA